MQRLGHLFLLIVTTRLAADGICYIEPGEHGVAGAGRGGASPREYSRTCVVAALVFARSAQASVAR